MKKDKIKKYKVNKTVFILTIILAAVFFITFLVFLILTNSELSKMMDIALYNSLIVLKEASLILFTLFTSSIISSCILEKANKNNEYFLDTLNEFVCDPRIIDALSESNQKTLKTSMFGFDNISQTEMIESIIDKLKDFDYYYEDCRLDISCDISNSVCKKRFSKVFEVRSFSDSFEIKNLRLYSSITKESSVDFLKIDYIKIDGNDLKPDTDYILRNEIIKPEERTSFKKGYKYRFICELKHPLKLSNNKSKTITLVYETCVTNDDCFINRLPGPCKKYHLSFAIENAKKGQYDINGSAFGFMDRGDRVPSIQENKLVFVT